MSDYHHEVDCDGLGCDNGRVLMAFSYEQCLNCIAIRDQRGGAMPPKYPDDGFHAFEIGERWSVMVACFGDWYRFCPDHEQCLTHDRATADKIANNFEKQIHDAYRRKKGLDE